MINQVKLEIGVELLPVKGFVMRVWGYGQYRIEAVLTKGEYRQPNVIQIKAVTIPRIILKTKNQKAGNIQPG